MDKREIDQLKPYATEAQLRYLEAIEETGSQRAAVRKLECNPRALERAIARVRRRAARAGVFKDAAISRPAPPGYKMRGYSTLGTNDDGEPTWFKYAEDKESREDFVRDFIESFKEDLPKLPKIKGPSSTEDDLMTVIPMGDPHFGMYAWARECGEDFNLDIAKRDLCAAVDYLVKRAPKTGRCVIINLGDFFHADNMEGRTSRSGHVLDMDTRLPKMFRIGLSAVRQCIASALQHHAVVEIINVVGNHDEVLSHVLSETLANIYEDEPRVVIHDDPTMRHYIQHGKCLVGAVHGHQTKDNELIGIMATERPEAWGETKFRYFFRGHHHHDSIKEFNGGIVEMVRTLAPKDSWHTGGGYLAGRDMKAIIMHKEYGIVERYVCGIDMLRTPHS